MTYRETLKTPPKKLLEPINGFSKAARYKFNIFKKKSVVDFPGGPVVESLPANAGHMG